MSISISYICFLYIRFYKLYIIFQTAKIRNIFGLAKFIDWKAFLGLPLRRGDYGLVASATPVGSARMNIEFAYRNSRMDSRFYCFF